MRRAEPSVRVSGLVVFVIITFVTFWVAVCVQAEMSNTFYFIHDLRHNLTHAIFPVYRWLILIYERTKTSSDEFPSPTATPHLPPAPPSHPSPHGSKNQQELLQTFCGQRFSFDEEHFSNAFALNVFKKLVITTGFP